MKPGIIAIVSSAPGWHERALEKAFARLAWKTRIIEPGKAGIRLDTDQGRVSCNGMDQVPAAVFVRGIAGGSLEEIIFRMNVLHVLKQQGSAIYNDPQAIERTVDKPLTSLLLMQAGLRIPFTWVGECSRQAEQVLRTLWARGSKVVQKPMFGSQGQGLHLLRPSDPLVRDEYFSGVWYLQEFIDCGRRKPSDVRVLVAGGKAVAAMRRENHGWITNRARGGQCSPLPLPAPLAAIATRAAALLGADYAGVDLIRDQAGRWYLLEVNGIPAWQGLERSCGLDISGLLARECADKAAAVARSAGKAHHAPDPGARCIA